MNMELTIWLIITAVILFLRGFSVTGSKEVLPGFWARMYYWKGDWFKYVPSVWFTLSAILWLIKHV